MENIRILVLGDEQVGKTSIIRCFLTQSFPLEVPACNPVVSIPPDISANRSGLKIIDTYIRKGEDTETLAKELQKVSLILLVFDVTRPETLKRIITFWLPFIKKSKIVPCILLGNKIDLPKHSQDLEEMGKEIRFLFPFCQIMIETTAKSFISISRIFDIAEQAVRFPSEALYDAVSFELTEKFTKALKLIFRLCDVDADFRLSNEEMNEFNKAVFGADITHKELEKIKTLIKENCADGVDHVGITLNGFIAINKIFIRKMKSENSWKILNHFKFDENIERNVEIVINQSSDSVIEYSKPAVDFLVKIFKKFSSHGLLTEPSISEILSTCSTSPWSPFLYENLVPTIENSLTIYSWLSLWHLILHFDPIQTIKSLLSIGYPHTWNTSFQLINRKDLQSRKVHFCLVLGHQKVGKKLLLQKFLNKSSGEPVNNTICGTIEEAEDVYLSSFLIMSKQETEFKPDVVCLVYDGSSAGINYIKKLAVDENTPRILMLNKNDTIDHESAYSFALELGLKECPQFNLRIQRPSTLFKQLKDYAINPNRVPLRRVKVKNKPKKKGNVIGWMAAGLVVIAAIILGKKSLKNVVM